jgi:hypothetical protein
MNDADKVINYAITTAHLFFSLRHFGADDKSQIYDTMFNLISGKRLSINQILLF